MTGSSFMSPLLSTLGTYSYSLNNNNNCSFKFLREFIKKKLNKMVFPLFSETFFSWVYCERLHPKGHRPLEGMVNICGAKKTHSLKNKRFIFLIEQK
jgi:hypothetical protein